MNMFAKKALAVGTLLATFALGSSAFAQPMQNYGGYGGYGGYGYQYPYYRAHDYIYNYSFHPYTIYVRRGTTVTWTNYDSVPHTVTSYSSYGGFSSGTLSPGERYIHTFWRPGVYYYHCLIHPEMTGRVVVY